MFKEISSTRGSISETEHENVLILLSTGCPQRGEKVYLPLSGKSEHFFWGGKLGLSLH